jgi:ubiquinone/menaquinone biosynthesis C-methylase UbiE
VIIKRVPLTDEQIAGVDAVEEYDRGAKLYMIPEYKYFVHQILRQGIKSGKVLDIGTGTGLLSIELAKSKSGRFQIIGLDLSENMIARAKDNAREARVNNLVEFVLSTAASMPFPDRTFDLVMSYASLHHWFHPIDVFNEAQRVTKDGGTIIIRDNLRVYGEPFLSFFLWLVTRFMDNDHRQRWRKSILASYTLGEIVQLLMQSKLNDYRVKRDFFLFDLRIEKSK